MMSIIEYFSPKNGALRRIILVGKQEHNVRLPREEIFHIKPALSNLP